jgi:hypothetical protein
MLARCYNHRRPDTTEKGRIAARSLARVDIGGAEPLMNARFLAQVAELVDAQVSGTCAARRGGSSPFLGTNFE